MKKICIVISSLWIMTQCLAAYPTIEGLFRNGNNNDLIGDFIVVKLIIEEVNNEEILRRIKVSAGDELVANVLNNEKSDPLFYKLIYAVEGEARADLLKIQYSSQEMKKRNFKSSKLIKGVRRMIRKDENFERGLFNSILSMLLMNESKEIVSVLHNLGITLPTNPMMMNSEKIDLLGEYKKYLMAIREDASLKEELISPIRPINEDEKLRVEELNKVNMYKRSENLSLVKEKNKFFWKVAYSGFEAYFRNEKHRLDRIQMNIKGKFFTINCGEYVLFNGVHELPVQMLVKDTNEKVYKIKMLSLSNFVNSGKSLSERARDYKKLEDKVPKTDEEQAPEREATFGLLY